MPPPSRYGVNSQPVYRLLLGVFKPVEVVFRSLDPLLDQGLFLVVAEVEIGGAHIQAVDEKGALPVVAVQVLVFLVLHQGADQGVDRPGAGLTHPQDMIKLPPLVQDQISYHPEIKSTAKASYALDMASSDNLLPFQALTPEAPNFCPRFGRFPDGLGCSTKLYRKAPSC